MRFFSLILLGMLPIFIFPQDSSVPLWRPDEKLLRTIMHEEFLRRIEKKIENERSGSSFRLDFNTERAYQSIRPLLQDNHEIWTDTRAQLQSFLRHRASIDEINIFQQEKDLFVLGMTIEIRDTLLTEFGEIRDFIISLLDVKKDLSVISVPSSREIRNIIKKNELPIAILSHLKNSGASIRDSRSGSFYNEFDRIKHFITGKHADRNQMPVYQLLDRYRDEYPELNDLLIQSRRILDQYRELASGIRQLIDRDQKNKHVVQWMR